MEDPRDWLTRFRAEVARLRGAEAEEVFKAESITLALLEREQRQLSLDWHRRWRYRKD